MLLVSVDKSRHNSNQNETHPHLYTIHIRSDCAGPRCDEVGGGQIAIGGRRRGEDVPPGIPRGAEGASGEHEGANEVRRSVIGGGWWWWGVVGKWYMAGGEWRVASGAE